MRDNLKEVLQGLCWGVIICALISMCCSCSHTKYVTVPEYHTQYVNKIDSIQVHDTLVHEKQTIIKELDSLALAEFGIALEGQQKAFMVQINDLKCQVNSQKEVIRDTVIRRDSIPYPVVQEVVKYKVDRAGWYVALFLFVCLGIAIKIK